MIISNCNSTNLNFKQKAGENNFKPAVYSADQFIADSISVEKKRIKGNFIARNLGSLTAQLGGLTILLLGELGCLHMLNSKKKTNLPKDKLNGCKNKVLLLLGAALATSIAFTVAVQKWQNKIIDEKSTKPQEFLEKYGSDTSAKLANSNLRSSLLAAQYNIINGTIEVNKNYIHDPIGKKMVKKYMKHELQHARQFEMIAGLDNGIEKINYACLHNIADYMKKNPAALNEINCVINDVNNDISGKFNGVKIPVSGAEVDLKKYVKALEIIINNPETKPTDIPIIIDVEHYKNALLKRGPLSDEEKLKAEEYYQAMLKYPQLSGLNLINPFSGYRSNILEKEARKASRAKNGRIAT